MASRNRISRRWTAWKRYQARIAPTNRVNSPSAERTWRWWALAQLSTLERRRHPYPQPVRTR